LRNLDFSSLHALITTLLSLAVITLIGVGIRLLTMVTIQQRRERMNRQINERLRALIAAYKTLGGSFTGDLTVDPIHRRDLRRHGEEPTAASTPPLELSADDSPGSDRARRIRDAVEAALSDIILLGTEEQVRLAVQAAHELVTASSSIPRNLSCRCAPSFARRSISIPSHPTWRCHYKARRGRLPLVVETRLIRPKAVKEAVEVAWA
jgi:hypothetical protein